jgi:hypothetical protein
LYLFFAGDRWTQWRAMVPLHKAQWKEMIEVMKFYAFIAPRRFPKSGHNAMAAFSYIGIYTMVFVEIVTGLVMYNWLRHSPVLTPLVGWIPRLVSIPNIRLIHFCLMFVFIAFGIFHVHLCLIVSSAEKARPDGQHLHRLQDHSAHVGDYVRAHVGFATERVSQEEAERAYEQLAQNGTPNTTELELEATEALPDSVRRLKPR